MTGSLSKKLNSLIGKISRPLKVLTEQRVVQLIFHRISLILLRDSKIFL
jgi:hypothetical protein